MALKGILMVALIPLLMAGAVLLFSQPGKVGIFLSNLAIFLVVIISITIWSLDKNMDLEKQR